MDDLELHSFILKNVPAALACSGRADASAMNKINFVRKCA
jgi:hypothetical protein